MAKVKNDRQTLDWVPPAKLWLIDLGGGNVWWCEYPDPDPSIDPLDVIGPYILQQQGGE